MTRISRRLNHRVLFPLCGLFFFVGTITVEAATYYVAQSGNDSNSCAASQNVASPKLTFASAVACLNPGDTLYIRAGTYAQQINLQGPNKTGTAGNYIKIAGYPGETVTIRYNNPSDVYGPIKARGNLGWFIFENLILDGVDGAEYGGWAIRDGNHDFILRNLEIKNFKNHSAIFMYNVNNVTIQNCRLHDQYSSNGASGTYHYGIYASSGSNILIEGSDFYNNAGGGMQIYPGPLSNVVIRNNKFHDNNTATGIKIGGLVVAEPDSTKPVTGVKIYNNLIYRNGSSPTAGDAPGIRINGVKGAQVWNNTIYGNKGAGLVISSYYTNPAANVVAQNNISYGNTGTQIIDAGTNTTADHNLTSNPNFVNAASLDFKLQTTSLAIDAGLSLSQVPTDFKMTPRPQGFTHDIGAYEAGTASASEPPAPPQNLSVR